LDEELYGNFTSLPENATVLVVVRLKENATLKARILAIDSSRENAQRRRMLRLQALNEEVSASQDAVLPNVSGDDFKLRYRFGLSSGFSAYVGGRGLMRLLRNDNVLRVEAMRWVSLTDSVSAPLVNVTSVWNLTINGVNITGAGQSVCVIDTGIDYTNSAFGSCSQVSFLAGNCTKIPYGYDFYYNDSNPMDYHGHGTNVAGIVASSASSNGGIAPGANIIAMKVFPDSAPFLAPYDVIERAISWCTYNSSTYNISVITMSLGSGIYSSSAVCEDTGIQNAYNSGMFIDASSGNDGSSAGIAWPSCNQYTVSVGAVYDANYGSVSWGSTCSDTTTSTDKVICFSNRHSLLSVWAPGSYITAAGSTYSGTSQASPHVAAAAALIQQYALLMNGSQLSPARVKAALVNTGKNVTRDVTKPRIDVFRALRYFNFRAPTLSNGSVSPSSGDSFALFNFTVVYSDLDDSAPSYVSAYVDGAPYQMVPNGSTNYFNGVLYYFNRTLSAGSHNFYFNASDGAYVNVSAVTNSPTVASPPNLTSPTVSPASGYTNTLFNYTVLYTNLGNSTPDSITVVLDGTQRAMQGMGQDYTSGVTYYYNTTLNSSSHNYYFNATLGNYVNTTALVSGSPVVQAPQPILSSAAVNPTLSNSQTLYNFTATYTHPANTTPTAMQLILDGVANAAQNTSANYSGGVVYYYNTTLSLGTHSFKFYTTDGTYTVYSSTSAQPMVYASSPSCSGSDPQGAATWTITQATECTDTAILPTSTHRGPLNITGQNTLQLTNTYVYLNNTMTQLNGTISLDNSQINFIR